MSYEVINTPRSKSVIRITGNTAVMIPLANLSAIPSETVTGAIIAQVCCSSDGIWKVYRGNDANGEHVIEIYQSANFVFYEFDVTIANNSTSNLYFTNSGTCGMLVMQVGKIATYNTDIGQL